MNISANQQIFLIIVLLFDPLTEREGERQRERDREREREMHRKQPLGLNASLLYLHIST